MILTNVNHIGNDVSKPSDVVVQIDQIDGR